MPHEVHPVPQPSDPTSHVPDAPGARAPDAPGATSPTRYAVGMFGTSIPINLIRGSIVLL